MDSNLLNHQIDDILESVLEEAAGDVYMVNPSWDAIEEFVSVATEFDGELPTVHMLADERTIKDVMADFIVASNAADLSGPGNARNGDQRRGRGRLHRNPEFARDRSRRRRGPRRSHHLAARRREKRSVAVRYQQVG